MIDRLMDLRRGRHEAVFLFAECPRLSRPICPRVVLPVVLGRGLVFGSRPSDENIVRKTSRGRLGDEAVDEQ